MAFTYKNVDRGDQLDSPMGALSLYGIARTAWESAGFEEKADTAYGKILAHYNAYNSKRSKHTYREEGVEYFSMLGLFNNLLGDRDTALNDANLAVELFTANGDGMETITGYSSAAAFMRYLDPAIVDTAASYRGNLNELRKSFKFTYQHNDIAALLALTRVVTKPGLVKSRVFETAYIIDHILDKRRFLATALLLGVMHVARFPQKESESQRPYYNQGSALFTLLTFSYTPAMDYGEDPTKADNVQFCWKIFGSCLGIDNAILPATFTEAKLLWDQFTSITYKRVTPPESLSSGTGKMLEVFDDVLPVKSKSLQDQADFVSFGVTLSSSGLMEKSVIGPVARLVGWYTSSNHAGLVCSKCKTVHGSRVSLFRLWHRCTVCKNVYCAECATGTLKLYATLAGSALMGWFTAPASFLYSYSIGWALGGSGLSGQAASRFLARKCCDEATEAIS